MGYAGFFGKILTQVRMVTPGSPGRERPGFRPATSSRRSTASRFFLSNSSNLEASAEKERDFPIDARRQELTLRITPRREGKVGKIGVLQTAEVRRQKISAFSRPSARASRRTSGSPSWSSIS